MARKGRQPPLWSVQSQRRTETKPSAAASGSAAHPSDSAADRPPRQVVLIDGSGFVYRAYHALPRLTTRSGMPTHAIYGFVQMLNKVLQTFEADAMAVVLDAPGPTFRHALYEEYKHSRPPKPPELETQWPYIIEITRALGIPILQMEGYEADDLIAAIARRAAAAGGRVIVVTSDKDMLQIVNDQIAVYHPQRDRLYTPERVYEEYGFPPERIVDFLALVGDTIDDIPGVKGIGEKSARELIQRYGSIEDIYRHLDEVPAKYRKKLEAGAAMAELSKRLIRLADDVGIDITWSGLRRRTPALQRLVRLLRELEFYSLLEAFLTDIHDRRPNYTWMDGTRLPEEWAAWVREIRASGRLALAAVWDGRHPAEARWIALGMSWQPDTAVVLPLTDGRVWDFLKTHLPEVLRDSRIRKIGFHWKDIWNGLRRMGITPVPPWDDPGVMSYVLDPSAGRHDPEHLARVWLSYRMIDRAAVRKHLTSWEAADPETLTDVVGEWADMALQVTEILDEELQKPPHARVARVYADIERPLIPVLADMEFWGIRLDVRRLRQLAHRVSEEVHTIQQTIFRKVGFTFNLNSHKQLSRVLFEHLGLQPGKKTPKTRRYSTRAEILEELAVRHEVPRLILTYRNLAKMKSTFIDPLLERVDPRTHRIHTRFHQTVTATGRLSSSDPNLQNIPIRDAIGEQIRACFVAESGWWLIMADYSQIELRILAHMSEDPRLIEAFNRGEDIHTRTAVEVLGMPAAQVGERERRLAKAINYGIVYGLSPYGLAQQTGMSPDEAQQFIARYFTRYPGVRAFLDQVLATGRERGYVETLFGRRRYIPELHSPDHQVRQAAERQAVNMPIQGTAADIMKLAMLRIDRYLKTHRLQSRILLQVHDEIILEVPDDEQSRVLRDVADLMQHVVTLRVPLVVSIHADRAWTK